VKILLLLTYYRPHWTGLTQYAARLAEGLANKNNRIEVLCIQHDRSLPRKEIINKVKVFREPYLFKFSRTLIAPFFLLNFLIRLLKNEVVVIYLPFLEVLPVVLLAKLLRKKVYLVHNGDLVLPREGGFVDRLTEKLFFIFTGESIKHSDGVIVQTLDYSNNSKLLSRYREKWKVILPLYEAEKININELRNFKERNKLKDRDVIGFSGRFVEEKGVDYLINAIPYVVKKNPGAYFVFAGEYKISYEKFWNKINRKIQMNKKHIILLGLIKDNKELACFYKSLDVLVQPSRSDCFPSSIVEALLYGVPVVCTNIPGARWAVKTTGMGLVVESKKPVKLAKGINGVLENKKKYFRPRNSINEIFNYSKTIREYERLFNS
jgi:glycosyltransferase involved in cell wall biosynthesis